MRATLITFTLALTLPLAASATTYDVVSGFSTAGTSHNGVWTYGSGLPSLFTPYSYKGTNFGPGYGFNYFSVGQNSLPGLGLGGTPFGTVNVPAGQLWLHPGSEINQDSIVKFTAPTAGVYTISSDFFHDDIAGGLTSPNMYSYSSGQYVGVYLDGVEISVPTLLGTDYGSSSAFTDTLTLAAGDTIDFAVAKNIYYYNDSTGLEASITTTGATPEPSSLVLLGTGILGLAGAARRKMRK